MLELDPTKQSQLKAEHGSSSLWTNSLSSSSSSSPSTLVSAKPADLSTKRHLSSNLNLDKISITKKNAGCKVRKTGKITKQQQNKNVNSFTLYRDRKPRLPKIETETELISQPTDLNYQSDEIQTIYNHPFQNDCGRHECYKGSQSSVQTMSATLKDNEQITKFEGSHKSIEFSHLRSYSAPELRESYMINIGLSSPLSLSPPSSSPSALKRC